MKKIITFGCVTSFLILPLFAQNGDRGSLPKQKDPIPADQIPPSPFLNAEKALHSFEVAEGFKLENIAEESVHQPVSLSFDADGRAWVVEMTNYMLDPDSTDENKPAGRIKVLEDTTGDGKLDKATVFLDKLILPRACAVTSDGLLYVHQDQLFFIQRGGDDGLAPVGEPLLIDKNYAVGGNAEHKPNGLLLGRDNWYYNAKSAYRYRRINGKWVKQKTAFRGQWGIAQDDAGRMFYNTNSTLLIGDSARPNLFRNHPSYIPKHKVSSRVGSNRIYPIRITPGVNRAYNGKILDKNGKLINCTAAAGMTIYRGENFPKELYGTAFISAPCGNLVKAISVQYSRANAPKGSFPFKNKEFIASTDEWFRPVNAYTAPDGTLWVIDMYMGMIQHTAYMTTYLRKQYVSRGLDKPEPNNGRIYRVRYTKNSVNKAPKMSKSSVDELTVFLSHPNGTVRDNAQRLLVERITTNAADKAAWLKANEKPDYSGFGLLHALWVSESIGNIPSQILQSGLVSSNSDVVNSALELAHLSTPSIGSQLIGYKPTSKTIHSCLFALGKLATLESYKRSIALIEQFQGKANLLEAAYVSGVGRKASAMLNSNVEAGKKLTQMLKQAARKGGGKEIATPKLPRRHIASYQKGKALYMGLASCSSCHGLDGSGQGDIFPPLAPSEWVNGKPDVLAKVIIHGLEGPIKVNGKNFKGESAMPKRPDLTDQQLADLMTYIRHLKGNKGGAVTADQIKQVRAATKNRSKAYTEKDLRKEMQ